MAKGGKKVATGGTKKPAEDERDLTLQAVVLADSFETRYLPFTLEKPRCLLPLANVPLLEYTLEFLSMSNVEDVYIYAGDQSEAIEQYLDQSKFNPDKPSCFFNTIECLKGTARSVGDALREIDGRGLIKGDFLLVNGDLVTNLDIEQALNRHRQRRVTDKNAIMTMVLRDAGPREHRTKAHGVTPVFVVDPSKDRCLHYEEMNPLQANKYVNIEPELLTEHAEVEIRSDLIDCGIDICTPDVLALWSDSFDYEVPRRHFLHGVLKDYELNGKTIHLEIIEDSYAARASDLHMYDAISKDILSRWTYPIVPENNLPEGTTYRSIRKDLCREDGVTLSKTCKFQGHNVVGAKTVIGDDTVINASIIGRNCIIGKNVVMKNAYIWDGVTISDNSTLKSCVVADGAIVGQDCHIGEGALLSYNVRISNGITIEKDTRITRAARRRSSAAANEQPTFLRADTKLVGSSGEGHAYEDTEDDLEDDEAILQSRLIYSTKHLNLSDASISTISSSISDDDFNNSLDPSSDRTRADSFNTLNSDEGGDSSSGENFHKDAVADVFKTLSEGGDFHNTRVEFTSLRLSNNASDHHIHRAIAVGFTKQIAQLIESGITPPKAVSQTLASDNGGARKFIEDVAIGADKAIEAQVDFLLCLQKDLTHREKGDIVLFALLKELYEDEVLEEEGYLAWWEDERSMQEGEMSRLREKCTGFIDWLQESEDDEDDEEEEEDEEDD